MAQDNTLSVWKQRFESSKGRQIWSLSSVGRAPPLQGGCHKFESYSDHHCFLGAAVVQLVRMPPCHGGGRGSLSSVGRAPPLQGGCHKFESYSDHHCFLGAAVVQLVRMPPCHGGGRGFESRPLRHSLIKQIHRKLYNIFYKIKGCFKRIG